MATKERIHQLVDSLPDTPETEAQLDRIEQDLKPNGIVEPNGTPQEGPIPTFEERLTKLAETIAGMDFQPREDAWR